MLSVHPDQSVTATAPRGTTPEAADARVRRRAPWVLKQIRRVQFEYRPREPRRFVSGASFYLLGRELRLKVRRDQIESVAVKRPYLYVYSRRISEAGIETTLRDWRAEQARARFAERLKELAPRILGRGTSVPAYRVVAMKRRWGSCSSRGTISLNPWLTEHPGGCIDYVLIHELCHLRHLNHGRDFERLLGRLLPDWRRWKRRLEGQM